MLGQEVASVIPCLIKVVLGGATFDEPLDLRS